MWQDIAITLIGLAVILLIGRKIYRFLMHPPKTGDPCAGCKGCALKEKIAETCKKE